GGGLFAAGRVERDGLSLEPGEAPDLDAGPFGPAFADANVADVVGAGARGEAGVGDEQVGRVAVLAQQVDRAVAFGALGVGDGDAPAGFERGDQVVAVAGGAGAVGGEGRD